MPLPERPWPLLGVAAGHVEDSIAESARRSATYGPELVGRSNELPRTVETVHILSHLQNVVDVEHLLEGEAPDLKTMGALSQPTSLCREFEAIYCSVHRFPTSPPKPVPTAKTASRDETERTQTAIAQAASAQSAGARSTSTQSTRTQPVWTPPPPTQPTYSGG